MMKLLKPRFPTYRETLESAGLSDGWASDEGTFRRYVDELKMQKQLPWWRRINWKLKEVEK